MTQTTITTLNHNFSEGDIITSNIDNYFNNVVITATPGVLTTRKMKWYEDTDTVFLYCILMMSFNFLVLTFIHWF